MGITKVFYLNSYAQYKGLGTDEGVDFLNTFGVTCKRYEGTLSNVTHMI
jgi:dCMP deaminase